MADDWRKNLRRALEAASNARGVWGYRPGSVGAAEPTALAALALSRSRRDSEFAMNESTSPDFVAEALRWLADQQQDDGAVPVSPGADGPHWTTAPALLAWLLGGDGERATYADNIARAIDWLLRTRGLEIAADASTHDHDTTLVGWSWVAGTHSWIEPTSCAILALRAAGQANHPRVREGLRLIVDRALPDGGWNYGNRRVLEHVLRPFPATTGIALAALAGEPAAAVVDGAIEYLSRELPRIRAPLSLAWGVMGLRAWDALPQDAESWLEECATRLLRHGALPHYAALLILAVADPCPPIRLEGGGANE